MAEHDPSREEPDRVDGGKSSDVDAMGQDKRRTIVGKRYGTSRRKKLMFYGIAVGVTVLVAIAFLTVVQSVDNRDMPLKETAPWTDAATLPETRDIDFPRNGPGNTIPPSEIDNR